MDYNEDLKVDKYSLDTEWESQAMRYMKWAEAYADAVRERDKTKERLDLTRAEVDAAVRSNPAEYGFEKKPTEAAIANVVISSEQYINANRELVEANRKVNVLAGAKEAMNHKKKALEFLSQLMIAGYYAEPNIDKEVKEASSKKTTQRIKEDLKRNRRLK